MLQMILHNIGNASVELEVKRQNIFKQKSMYYMACRHGLYEFGIEWIQSSK